MTLSRSGFIVACLSGLLTISLVASPASAIILQDGNQPTNIPGADLIGTADTQANCVVIAPNMIITTRHQGMNTNIVINGVSYTAVETMPHATADLRVSRIVDSNGDSANLTSWAELWTTDQGNEIGQNIILGGYGKSTGAFTGSGYLWGPETSVDQLRWGTNIIDSALSKTTYNSGTSDVLELDFTRLISAGNTPFEASVATYDSGGGWYIDSGGTWYVAGITRGTERNGETRFNDWADAVRVSSYADWIYSITRIDGDIDGDLTVSVTDLGILAGNYNSGTGLTWYQGDIDGNGEINVTDLGMLAGNYGFDGTNDMPTMVPTGAMAGGSAPEVPEPTTAVLLALAGPALLARKRRSKGH